MKAGNPAATPIPERSQEAFLSYVDGAFAADIFVDAERIVFAVFCIFSRQLRHGEAAKIRGVLPKGIRQLWTE